MLYVYPEKLPGASKKARIPPCKAMGETVRQ